MRIKTYLKIQILISTILIPVLVPREIRIKKDRYNEPFTKKDMTIVVELAGAITNKEVESIFIGSVIQPLKYLMCIVGFKPQRDLSRNKMIYHSLEICNRKWDSFPKFESECHNLIQKQGWATCQFKLESREMDIFVFEWGELVLSVSNPEKLEKETIHHFLDMIKKKKFQEHEKTTIDENGKEWTESSFFPEIDPAKIHAIAIKKVKTFYEITLHQQDGDTSGHEHVFHFYPEKDMIIAESSSFWIT